MSRLIKQNPRMSFLLVGFLLGCVVAGIGVYSTTQSTDIYKEQVTKLERKLIIAEYNHEELSTAHKALKTTFNESFKEVISPDGTKTITRITNNTSDSVSSETADSTTTLSQSTETTAAQTAVRESISKDLNLTLSLDTDLDVHIGAGYRVLPPFSVELGVEIDPYNPNVIKGLRLGIGIRL